MLILLLRTLVIYLLILGLMRLMGKRQLGELQPAELVSTILISNLASISIESPEIPLAASLAPVLLIVSLELLLSCLCFDHPDAGELISGRPVAVIRDGKIDQKALRELRCSAGELMTALRSKDIFDPAEVTLALMETSGRLSVCRCGPGQKKPPVPFVTDGKILDENLLWCGKDRRWLNAALLAQDCRPEQAFLVLGDDGPDCRILKKEAH